MGSGGTKLSLAEAKFYKQKEGADTLSGSHLDGASGVTVIEGNDGLQSSQGQSETSEDQPTVLRESVKTPWSLGSFARHRSPWRSSSRKHGP